LNCHTHDSSLISTFHATDLRAKSPGIKISFSIISAIFSFTKNVRKDVLLNFRLIYFQQNRDLHVKNDTKCFLLHTLCSYCM